ncbi:unnamed protein product [Ranitomeya imitator]|uniref:Ribonuclease H2 subunit B n=1 Tax=Ranitomeya imitator TaxID=111125 RepID=A0ABN9MRV0_9NEOB|nr:unnamed protein product [Ranitomeya imitator]
MLASELGLVSNGCRCVRDPKPVTWCLYSHCAGWLTMVSSAFIDKGTMFLFINSGQQVCEVKAFQEEFRSWFIGQTVQEDGRLLYATPVDPLYLVLYYLIKADKEQGKFQPAEQIVVDEEFPSCNMLLQCTQVAQSLHHVTEEKEIGSKKFYRYSKEKTLSWLKKKVDQTVKVLKASDVCVGGSVQSASYIRIKQESDIKEEDYMRYAHGLISEYIPKDLRSELSADLKCKDMYISSNDQILILCFVLKHLMSMCKCHFEGGAVSSTFISPRCILKDERRRLDYTDPEAFPLRSVPMGVAVRSGVSHLLTMKSSSCLHAAAPAQPYFVCPVEGRAKYCSAQALGLSDISRWLRTAVHYAAINRTDKVRLRRSCSMKTRRGRHRKKIGGPGLDRDAHRIGPPLGEYNLTSFSHLSGYIGGLSTALQNAVDKPLMPVGLAHLRFWG